MKRPLAFAATTGLIGAAGFLTLGFMLSGPNWTEAALLLISDKTTCGPKAAGPEQLTLPFTTTGSLAIRLPASVHYQPGEKQEAVIDGDAALIGHVRIEQGEITLDCEPGGFASRLEIRLSGPAIKTWELRGRGDLTLSQINQPELRVDIMGSGKASASGIAETVDVSISGSGSIEFEGLAAQSVNAEIRGSGDIGLSAEKVADVAIFGSGNVDLYGNPTMRRSEIKGSGRIRHMP